MKRRKILLTAFRGGGRGKHAVAKLISDRRAERQEENIRGRIACNPADILSSAHRSR